MENEIWARTDMGNWSGFHLTKVRRKGKGEDNEKEDEERRKRGRKKRINRDNIKRCSNFLI